MRLTSATMRSASSQIRCVSSLVIGSRVLLQQLCGSPYARQGILDLMGEHRRHRGDGTGGAGGGRVVDRACRRYCVCCREARIISPASGPGPTSTETARGTMRGEPIVTPCSVRLAPESRTCSTKVSSGKSLTSSSASERPAAAPALTPKKSSAAPFKYRRQFSASTIKTGSGRSASIAFGSGPVFVSQTWRVLATVKPLAAQ